HPAHRRPGPQGGVRAPEGDGGRAHRARRQRSRRQVSDKTEDPTPRRLAKAREKGEVAVSAVTSQSLGFLVAVLVVPAALTATAARATELLRAALSGDATRQPLDAAVKDIVLLVTPVLVAVAATAALATIVQTGALFAPARMAPNLAKLDPIAGL